MTCCFRCRLENVFLLSCFSASQKFYLYIFLQLICWNSTVNMITRTDSRPELSLPQVWTPEKVQSSSLIYLICLIYTDISAADELKEEVLCSWSRFWSDLTSFTCKRLQILHVSPLFYSLICNKQCTSSLMPPIGSFCATIARLRLLIPLSFCLNMTDFSLCHDFASNL